ncbi:hypothetical protein ASE61_00580 [Bosea sp. Root670]|uniref:hypothetical protein n=1 Tax=Bosea sp. Root670 TaxID=1736583 RepID=UPI0007128C6C|nr:hypothetical protein [Bosea sp. Root670]KRE08146.1 hypothetical protein ASE61_00580 [Bosea sp. Root670]
MKGSDFDVGIRELSSPEFYIVDLRHDWLRRPCISFWRPSNAGYAYPLTWSGRYGEEQVRHGSGYGACYRKEEGGKLVRFAVECSVVEAMGVPAPPKIVDNDVGPVVLNTAANRKALRLAHLRSDSSGRNLADAHSKDPSRPAMPKEEDTHG